MLDFHLDKLFPKEFDDEELEPDRGSDDPAPIRELGVPRPESQKVLLVPGARWRTGWIWMGLPPAAWLLPA